MESILGNWKHSIYEHGGSWTIELLGGIVALVSLSHIMMYPEPIPMWAFEIMLAVALSTLFVVVGSRLNTSGRLPAEQWHVARWTVVGVTLGTVFAGWLVFHQRLEGIVVAEPLYLLSTTAAVGGLFGLFTSAYSLNRRVKGSVTSDAEQTPESRFPSKAFDGDASKVLVTLSQRDIDPVQQWVAAKTPTDAETRRLLILEFFKEHRNAIVSIDELAFHLLESDPALAKHYDYDSIMIKLHHSDLPYLAEIGVVTYGAASSNERTSTPN